MSRTPILRNINNTSLKAIMAMPTKNSTSNGDSNFSLSRRLYIDSYTAPPTKPLVKQDNHGISQTTSSSTFGCKGFSLINHTANSQASTIQKKWINGNRDASQIVQNRRVHSIGTGSLNAANTPISFMSNKQTTVVNEAIHRVRHSGGAAPQKKLYKHMDYAKLF